MLDFSFVILGAVCINILLKMPLQPKQLKFTLLIKWICFPLRKRKKKRRNGLAFGHLTSFYVAEHTNINSTLLMSLYISQSTFIIFFLDRLLLLLIFSTSFPYPLCFLQILSLVTVATSSSPCNCYV